MRRAAREARRWASRLLRPGTRVADAAADRRRRELERLAAWPRFTPTSTDLLGTHVELVDAASFLWTYHEIFVNRLYEFPLSSPAPRILDCGANIGLSVLFFKSWAPGARLIAFEPDPALVNVLERNVREARLTGVTIKPCALWSSAATVGFASDGADGGRIDVSGAATVQVATVRLRDYLDEPVDLLKLDIEGAETDVLLDCEDRLASVRRAYVEYHSFADRPQSLHVLLGVLARSGFRVYVNPVTSSTRPFLVQRTNNGFDLQLHVFAVRPEDRT